MTSWLEQIDPGGHRSIKGLRLVAAYGLAAVLGIVLHRSFEFWAASSLPTLLQASHFGRAFPRIRRLAGRRLATLRF